jgi:hypothetical protein
MSLTIPAELGPAAEVFSELCDRVHAVEHERAVDRQVFAFSSPLLKCLAPEKSRTRLIRRR